MNNIFKTAQLLYFTLTSINYRDFFLKYKFNASDNIVVIFPDFPRQILQYFYSDAFLNDVALINAVVKIKSDFTVILGKKRVLNTKNKNVFFNMGQRFRNHYNDNYSDALIQFVKLLETNNNKCYPNSNECEWWENKEFMQRKFEELDIKIPKTQIIDLVNFQIQNVQFEYPFLIKEVHSSGSQGVHKIKNEKVFAEKIKELAQRKDSYGSNTILIQELLKMDRDFRVVIIGEEIVLHYWRINPNIEWKPTSTKHGSRVDFIFFPDKWRTHIISEFKKTGLSTGAFDLVWVDNDMNLEPYILEISPSYQPNPPIPKSINTSYGNWKTQFKLIDNYPKKFVSIVNEQKVKLVKNYFKSN